MKRALVSILAALSLSACVPARPAPPKPPGRQVALAVPPPTMARENSSRPLIAPTPLRQEPLPESLPPTGLRADEQAPPPEPAKPPRLETVIASITSSTPPRLATSLRLTDQGRQRLDSGDFPGALDRLEQAIKVDPANPHGYYWLAHVHYRRERFDQAIAFADKAAVLFARTDAAWLSQTFAFRGAIFEQIGRFAEARAAYGQAVQAEPGNVAARAGLARLGGTPAP